jgi:hypothetical protein
MLVEQNFNYLHADREYYEPFGRYREDPRDFIHFIRRMMPSTWKIERGGIWCHCTPPGGQVPVQGWKIHLSATLANSPAVLATAARILARDSVAFKFAADKNIVFMQNGKRWDRGGAGKFITIYPMDEAQCADLLEKLYRATIGYSGPYILSDRRYREGSIVHYRYGGIIPARRLDVTGRMVPVIQLAGGQYADDDRMPYFHLPEGMTDPFNDAPPEAESGEATLKNGRYVIESALVFSNSGGVYTALDRETGETVIIKEARPLSNVSPRGTDSVWLLKKEHRLLTVLEDAEIAPRPVDFFKDWEHYYLVEEFVKGTILRGFTAEFTLGLRTRATLEYAREFYDRYRRVFVRLAEVVQILHERRIVFGDLSHYNVMVLNGGESIRLIDFEGAYEQDVDPPTLLFTPGFAPLQMIDEGMAAPEDDVFAVGGLMLAALDPINSLMMLNPQAHVPFVEALTRDIALPKEIAGCITALLDQDRSRRPDLAQVVEVLSQPYTVGTPLAGTYEADHTDLEALVQAIVHHIGSVADFGREDRLFPADPAVFETNPLSLAHGACGVAYALKKITGSVPRQVADWILSKKLSAEAYPPGLWIGLSGIAWALLELGFRDEAKEALRLTRGHRQMWRSPDLFYGAAGWGMAQLRFFLESGDEEYLDAAREAGAFLRDNRQEEDGACWWPAQKDICCGLAHGASGVSLFLLYLFLATRDEQFLDVGRRGLKFVTGKALRNVDGGLTWRAKEGERTFTPYWRWGSSGVGMVLLRYLKVGADEALAKVLEDLLIDTDRKYSIFPGQFFGLAGIGEFYLDLADFTDDRERAIAGARKTLSGLLPFQLARADGIAFPGETLSRISCDYGTGGAGIALFIHRLLKGGGPSFMLDELLAPRPS